jgi:hypothetical protein
VGKLLQRLQDPSRSDVYRVRGDAEVLDAARGGGLSVRKISLRGVRAKDGLLERIARELQLPDWFGNNWDALEDCLTEVHGHFLLYEHDLIGADDLGVLVDVLASSAEYWAERGEPFFAIFVDPAGKLELKDLFREA